LRSLVQGAFAGCLKGRPIRGWVREGNAYLDHVGAMVCQGVDQIQGKRLAGVAEVHVGHMRTFTSRA